jgi:hypothetical protein
MNPQRDQYRSKALHIDRRPRETLRLSGMTPIVGSHPIAREANQFVTKRMCGIGQGPWALSQAIRRFWAEFDAKAG